MRLILWEQFHKTHQIAERVRVKCIVLNCFLGGAKQNRGYPYIMRDIPRVCHLKNTSNKMSRASASGADDLIASYADPRGGDNFRAEATQYYFDCAGLRLRRNGNNR